ncbi:MAG: sigma-70 family RNA polymerase sigma factor [Armatimonadetes bacterium]|nr:sigma-70 family RNA polymerase sigma factor [Armatimonadota bacterium]
MAAPSVGELVQRARRGDRSAFGELVDRYRDMVYGLAYHLTGNFDDARDLTQEALVRAYERLTQLRDANRFPAWLRRITANTHRSLARRRRPSGEAPGPEVTREPSDLELTVREALSSLRQPDRLALTLHYINGYTHAEIGEFLGQSADVVKTRLARARKRLRTEVTQMVGDAMACERLPAGFRNGVMAGVEGLVGDLRRVLPTDLKAVIERLRQRRNALWREVMAARPDADQPLQEHGHAPVFPVRDLSEAARHTAVEAIHLTQMLQMLGALNPPPWVEDPDCLWIRVTLEPTDRPLAVWLANVPGTRGHIHQRQFATDDPLPPALSGRPGEIHDVSQLLASLASDLVDAARAATEVQGALAAALPADAAALAAELTAQAGQRFSAAEPGLTDEQRRRMADKESVSVRELAAEVREDVRQAVALLWARDVCGEIAHPPPWAVEPRSSRLEFGLYPQWSDLGDAAGREYVRIWSPVGQNTLQTGIWA